MLFVHLLFFYYTCFCFYGMYNKKNRSDTFFMCQTSCDCLDLCIKNYDVLFYVSIVTVMSLFSCHFIVLSAVFCMYMDPTEGLSFPFGTSWNLTVFFVFFSGVNVNCLSIFVFPFFNYVVVYVLSYLLFRFQFTS